MSGDESTSGDSSPTPDSAGAKRTDATSRVDEPAADDESGSGERRDGRGITTIGDRATGTGRSTRSAGKAAVDGAPPTDDLWKGHDARAERVSYELDVYAGLLDALLARGYEFVGFGGEVGAGQILLRHDVDISMERAAAMARVEAALGIASTYCLLVTTPLYDLLAPENRAHLRTIVECGHDVGLHFDPHYYWDAEPPTETFQARVVADRTALEGVLDAHFRDEIAVAATSIHQPPDWTLGVSFDAFENAYEPRYFEAIEYVSDSGGKWRTGRPFEAGVPSSMQLLVHPGLWGVEDRPLRAVLEERQERCRRRIEAYVGPFGG